MRCGFATVAFVATDTRGEIPARAGCVKGRRMATVAKCKFDLEVCGGTYVNEPCVVDGNLITARFPYDLPRMVDALVKQLVKA